MCSPADEQPAGGRRVHACEHEETMSSIFGRWFGYGVGSAVGKSLLPSDDGPGGGDERPRAEPPIRGRTETEIRADEKQYAEDEKRMEDEARAAKT